MGLVSLLKRPQREGSQQEDSGLCLEIALQTLDLLAPSPASGPGRNKCMLFISQLVYIFVTANELRRSSILES